MRTRTLARSLAAGLVLAAALGSTSVAMARFGSGGSGTGSGSGSVSTPATVSGTVQTIDPSRKNVTIRTAVGATVKLAVGRSTRVTRNGAPSSLTGLALNDSVSGTFNAATLAAATLAASGPAVNSVKGRARSVSFSSGAVTVGMTALQTTANTRVVRNGQVVSLRQVTLRDSLVAHAAAGTNVALDVVANGPEELEVRGIISAVTDTTVTIAPDDASPPVTLTVGPTTVIEVSDAPGTIADLQVALAVEAEYDPTTLVAFSISAGDEEDEAEVAGTVSAVDPTAGTITITPNGGGADVTLVVNAATEIDVNDDGASLADIQVGMPVKAEYDATTLLAREIEAGVEDDEVENESETESD